jgi:NADPH:quinone reductase-like Zn-dependent oxidoreductase
MLVGKVNDVWTRRVETISSDDLGEGEVLIAVEYSCINYKDGLSTTEKGKVARIDPLIPGVDLAGTVVESSDPSIAVGTKVIVHGNDIGVAHNGGFATMARVPAKWVIPVPGGLTTKTAMMVMARMSVALLAKMQMRRHRSSAFASVRRAAASLAATALV